ncbi:MAG: DUF5655 domain-containing protein [Candidatus Marinimicrobia bacterium]|nr:DUF5655 domain-containing protein [Candidatus Neomarinimicrobiota bacterium]MDP6610742.1 DUF5655 domain-containing protein [Candidatus Neomarinimicrobiota bacterium]
MKNSHVSIGAENSNMRINGTPFMDESIHRTEKVSSNLYSHFIIISGPNDIDLWLIRWINEAYTLTNER